VTTTICSISTDLNITAFTRSTFTHRLSFRIFHLITTTNYLNMKFLAASLLATLAAASPIAAPAPEFQMANDLEVRQFGSIGSKSELEQGSAGSCPKAILVFARGSTETGNLVRLLSPEAIRVRIHQKGTF
jgi:hypothetical protein